VDGSGVGCFNHTRWFLVAWYALAVVWGIRMAWYWIPTRLDMLVSVASWVILSSWAIIDAKRRGRAIPLLSQQWFFLAVWLLVPGYVVWSRGWRGVGYLILHGVLWMVLANLVMYVAWWTAHG
jgi:hypothetical protein